MTCNDEHSPHENMTYDIVVHMTTIKKFENGPISGPVRALNQDGVAYLVLSDIAPVLGVTNTSNAVRQLRASQYVAANEENRKALGVPAGRAPYLVTEGGFYRLAMRSSREEAVPFQEWVEDEVLPSIRKEGGYLSEGISEDQLEAIVKERFAGREQALMERFNRSQLETDREYRALEDSKKRSSDEAWETVHLLEAYNRYLKDFTVHCSSRDAMTLTQFRKERWD